jgi:hypothetical protein
MVKWKRDTGKARVPTDTIHDMIDEEASILNRWEGLHNRPVDVDRVWDLLRGPKSRRLPLF